ncbi:unnamed protein product [Meganyctiphanes norvegica]|uniref:Lipocalin/cytosolic fatty-acid binding domain-containing protein n=1 Tax=Meganyctiphanes norvegica TaxID=48144 RepID=A0AAV2Q4M0_MEGNR
MHALAKMFFTLLSASLLLVEPTLAAFGMPEFLVWGDCQNITLMEDFNLNKYQGLWFDIESVPNEYQYVKKCVTQNYIWTGEQLQVQTRGLTVDDEKIRQVASMAIEMDTMPANDPAHMTVTADGVPEAPYQIIDTDYHNYACVYSCMSFVGFKAEFSWVFSRAPVLAQEFIDKCHNKLTEMSVDPSLMNKIVQADVCPYWEKLPKMLEDSKTQLSKQLGPDPLATGSSPSKTIDEMQTIVSSSGSSSGTAVQEVAKQDVAHKVDQAPKTSVETDSSSTSHADRQDGQEENKAPQMVSSAYILTLFMTALLTVLMR